MTTAIYNGKKCVVQFLDNEIMLFDYICGSYVKTIYTINELTSCQDEETRIEYIRHIAEPPEEV